MAAVLELIAGSYEQIAFGYRVKTDEKEWTAKPNFTHHAHTASISAVAASERFVVTGSKDETIQLYDMKKKTEHGALLHHDGSITCLEFYGSSHLLSGGEDGLVCVWSTKKWECLKSIKAHKGTVTSLSVHPSGKLALTVGTDKTLRTWNLTNGRSAFIKNIKQNAHIVRWSPDGDKYVVVVDDKVIVYNLETASVTGTITNPKRISSVKFLNNSILAVAGDDEIVRLCDVEKEKWELESPTLLGEVNTTARLTCLAVWKPSSVQKIAEEPAAEATTSKELAQELSKTKRVRIVAEEVILEDESKPKKKKNGRK
ncbi:p21-activated protein kinase-interacting protein 1-like PAK1-interacting protein 1-like [Collichthys lucidus]|uniref:p21-activated protein kinase-interacting protein 1-like PAK1-interacting protein 1-like n=1 Tax=Collichthys lucidus TaxID=240159 RepID=A0A4U5V048_COLLU|nr:p21-activated protein kinase-interacting protein 1-like PAK1-interacting protein 1-like [Collichthys lucidus]